MNTVKHGDVNYFDGKLFKALKKGKLLQENDGEI